MKILRAAHLGMCFGVRDAIALAEREAAQRPVTILGDLVHNETVLESLRRQGVRIVRDLPEARTETILITAHGASQRKTDEVRARGHRLVEATCPLVRFAHDRLLALARAGFHPVVIGQRDHVEVRGLTGDLAACDVILQDEDVERLTPRPRLGVAAQTTQPLARVHRLLALLRARFPNTEIRFEDTVCAPTKQRQRAAETLAAQCDVVIVVGGAHSNNTRELVATCQRSCPRVHHLQEAAELRASWFLPDDTVGLTAGTSTPDAVIEEVEDCLNALARLADGVANPRSEGVRLLEVAR